MALYGGLEGGGTNTVAVLVDAGGRIVARQDGSGSNGWLLGVGKVADLLVALFQAAKRAAGVPETQPLEALGLCMSGFLQPRAQQELREALRERDPHLSRSYFIDNDSPGSVFTASGPRGGVVIISGTGTMAQLITPEGRAVNCGGWGHCFGDEASAYYIAERAIRRVFWALDGFVPEGGGPPPDVAVAHAAMLEYFQVRAGGAGRGARGAWRAARGCRRASTVRPGRGSRFRAQPPSVHACPLPHEAPTRPLAVSPAPHIRAAAATAASAAD